MRVNVGKSYCLRSAIVVITIVVMSGNPDLFAFYYPVALAYAMVFVRRLTLIFTGILAIGYTAVFWSRRRTLCGTVLAYRSNGCGGFESG
jgi:hypothetical protein